jgi:hypothetical protein
MILYRYCIELSCCLEGEYCCQFTLSCLLWLSVIPIQLSFSKMYVGIPSLGLSCIFMYMTKLYKGSFYNTRWQIVVLFVMHILFVIEISQKRLGLKYMILKQHWKLNCIVYQRIFLVKFSVWRFLDV